MTDAMDLKILGKLQQDCTISLDVLSDCVGLSPTSCYRRIRKLEESGVIRAKQAILDEKKLGFQVTAMFMVRLDKDSADIDRRMKQILANHPEVQQCYLMTGDYDFMMIAKLRDANEYTDYIYHFLETYRDIPIQNYSSSMVIRTIKQTAALPLSQMTKTTRPSQGGPVEDSESYQANG